MAFAHGSHCLESTWLEAWLEGAEAAAEDMPHAGIVVLPLFGSITANSL
jgi:hypothetical protein